MIFRKNHCSQRGVETRGWNDSQYLEEYNIENMYKKKKKMSGAGKLVEGGEGQAPPAVPVPAPVAETAEGLSKEEQAPEDLEPPAGTKRSRVEPNNGIPTPTPQQIHTIVQMVQKDINGESSNADVVPPAASQQTPPPPPPPPPAPAAGDDVNVKPPTPEEIAAQNKVADAQKLFDNASDDQKPAAQTALDAAKAELAALKAKAGGRRRTKRKNGKKSHKKGKSSKKVAKRRKSRKSSSSRRRRSSRKQNKH